jgi:hypothetical protein
LGCSVLKLEESRPSNFVYWNQDRLDWIDGDVEWDLSSDLVEKAISGEGMMSSYIDCAMPFG